MRTMAIKSLQKRDALGKIQAEMALQLDRSGAPEEVRAFLMEGWSLLLSGIYQAKGNQDADWKAGWETVNALLWSLAPKHGREETGALLRMLPTLLSRLHAGCAALGMELAERDRLFERLAMLHAAIAREGLRAGLEAEGPITRLRESEAGGAEDSVLRDLAAPDLPARQRRQALPELKLGDPVMFQRGAEERRLILTWISPMGGMYMFANEQGLDAITLTQARLAARFRAGEARLERA